MRQRIARRKKSLKSKSLPRRRRSYLYVRKKKSLKLVAASYNQGFDTGYNKAINQLNSMMRHPEKGQEFNAEEEYKRGLYDGGDAIVNSLLPDLDILPDISIRQIIEAGVEQLRPQILKLMGAPEVGEQIIEAMNTRSPLSVVRLGDGELLTLAQESVLSEEQVRRDGYFLSYAGVHIPDLNARDQLLYAIQKASIVGIPILRMTNFQPFAFAVFKAHGINYRHLRLTSSTINYSLYLEGHLTRILTNRSILIVGNTAPELSQFLSSKGMQVAGVVAPVNGMQDIPRVMSEIAAYDYDIALVGAGIPAVIIVQQIASQHGKVAIDFGHLADSFIKGEAQL